MPVTPFGATVREAGGGWVTMIVDRDAAVYPSTGEHVVVFPGDEGTTAALALVAESAERWHRVQAMLGPDVLDDIAAGRIVRQDDAGDDAAVIGWIDPEVKAGVSRARANGYTHYTLRARIDRPDHLYTVPLQTSPPAVPRTVRVPWAKAVEQQLTAISADLRRPQEVAGAAVFDGQVELTDRHDRAIVPVGDDGMVEVLDDGPGGVVVPPTPEVPDHDG